jgi:hypothetical protein
MLIMTEGQAGITSAFYAHGFKNKFWKNRRNRLTVIPEQVSESGKVFAHL